MGKTERSKWAGAHESTWAKSEFQLRKTFLRSRQDCNKNRDQLVTFLSESCESFGRNNLSIDQQFKPVGGLFKLAQRIATLRDKLRFAASAIPLAIICSN